MKIPRFLPNSDGLIAVCLPLLLLAISIHAQQPADHGFSRVTNHEPRTTVFHESRVTSHEPRLSTPLGGIGAGTFQIMPDGAISRSTLAGNWDRPTGDLPGCFAVIRTQVDTYVTTRVLALHSPYELPTIANLSYDGLYPQAQLRFDDGALPVSLTLLAFTPLVPFVIKDSSYPAAAFIFRLHNPQSSPVEVSIALSWESILGVGSDGKGDLVADRTGVTAMTIPSGEGYFGIRFASPASAAQTGLRANTTGEMAMMTYPQLPQATITTAGWNALDRHPGWWDGFVQTGDVVGSAPVGAESSSHPAGVVAVRLTLKPNDYVDLPFAVAWYLPHWIAPDGKDYGHFYQTAFSSASQAARLLLSDWDSLYALTEEWQKRLTFSNLPDWLARRLINSAAPLTANSIHTRDGRFALIPRLGAPLPTSAAEQMEASRQHLAANALLLALYPRLDANMLLTMQGKGEREKGTEQKGRKGEGEKGSNPKSDGREEGRGKREEEVNQKSKIDDTRHPTPDTLLLFDSVFVLEMAQYVRWTGDHDLLTAALPAVRGTLQELLSLKGDGLPAYPPGSQTRSSTLTLWLAALRAGQALANMAQQQALAHECAEAAAQGAAAFDKRYWNGRCYGDDPDIRPSSAPPLCSRDQLLGQWIAYQLGFGPLLPQEHLHQALRTLLDSDPLLSMKGTEGREEGRGKREEEVNPKSKIDDTRHPTPDTLLLGEAALALWQDVPAKGIDLLQQMQTARNDTLHSSRQSPPAGAGSANVSPGTGDLGDGADWNLLYALAGFNFDRETGELALMPNIPGTWRTFTCPIFAPTFWGTLEFKPSVHGGVLGLRIDRLMDSVTVTSAKGSQSQANLTLRSLRVTGPPSLEGSSASYEAHVSVGRKPIGFKMARDADGDLKLIFDTPLTLSTGDRLEVDVH